MFDFFNLILGYIEMVIGFFIGLVESLIDLIAMIQSLSWLPLTVVGFVPSFLGAAVLGTTGICVAKLLLGR